MDDNTRQQRRRAAREAAKPTREQLAAQGHTGPIYDIGQPVPTSTRGGIRTKGRRFSRCTLIDSAPSPARGVPGMLFLHHPTRGGGYGIAATPANVATFFPALPPSMAASLTGEVL